MNLLSSLRAIGPRITRSTLAATQHVAQERPRMQQADHRQSQLFGWMRFVFKRVSLHTLVYASMALSAFASCTAPKNQIEAENCLPGNPPTDWYLDGVGSPNIEGFTTDISVNVVKPSIFGEPTPSRYQSVGGLPGRQFSASIWFRS